MTTREQDNSRLIFGSLVFVLGALFLLINLAGVARLAYDVVVLGAPTNLLVKVLILTIVFAFGLALGMASVRRFGNAGFLLFGRVYTWTFLGLTCLTYLGIALRISTHDYSVLLYGAFLLIIIMEVAIMFALRLVVADKHIGIFSIPVLAIVLFHLLLIVYKYVFASIPLSAYLLGDLFFLLLMASVGTSMMGESAFRSVIERVIERVN